MTTQSTAAATKNMANAIRALAMDAVEQANSGHPGMPMGMADVATALFARHLKFDPANPRWADRDRFVLSAGHGSMLLYALLHLTGYAQPTMADIRNFRQWGSPCAGHPEFGDMPGIEVTTGPLGQGLAMAVGLALAERQLNADFGDALVDHRTYVIAGDGCLMEGVSQEAISLAGHLKLNRLVVLWDDNGISIDGPVSLSSSEDMAGRFVAAGWSVQAVDGHDVEAVDAALARAKRSDKPSLIACKTQIGKGSPAKQGSEKAHGSPLGKDEIAATRANIGWSAPAFEIPADILAAWRAAGARGAAEYAAWVTRHAAAPARADFDAQLSGNVPAAVTAALKSHVDGLIATPQKIASRKASEAVIEAIAPHYPALLGGSADLTHSNFTKAKTQAPLSPSNYAGRHIHYGIREFGMAACMNGLALHGGVVPYGGTFLVFTDYCRSAIRMSALQHQRVVYVMTHDSIGLGEDGPTHQPVEHVMSLRAMPNVLMMRPGDAVETSECWELALKHMHGPSVLALSRQNLPQLRLAESDNMSAKGAYVLADSPNAKVVLIATGSELHIAAAARELLEAKGIATRLVSMPCWELFDVQSEAYRDSVLLSGTFKASVEAGVSLGWERYVGRGGLIFGIDRFGASAPADRLYQEFGFTSNNIADSIAAAL
jgi:transketolase